MIEEKEFDFARALKAIRDSRGLTQRALGELMGIEAGRISNWELGFAKPTVDMFRDLCIALNCPPGDLLGLSPAPLSGEEYNLVKGFRSLDDHDRETAMTMMESLLKRHL